MDRTIARVPYLYKKYLDQFQEVMERLDSNFIRGVFDDTTGDLALYFQSESVVRASEHDLRPIECWEALQKNLELICDYLNKRVTNLKPIAGSQ